MSEKKREAEAAIDLMSAQYERNCIEEERRNGLLILNAIYGKIDDDFKFESNTTTNSNYAIDVKIPLQCLVKDSKLILQESGKVNKAYLDASSKPQNNIIKTVHSVYFSVGIARIL